MLRGARRPGWTSPPVNTATTSTISAHAVAAGAVDVLQADMTRCGGVTGFLQVARCARRTTSTCPRIAHRRRTCTPPAPCRGCATRNGSTTTCASSTCCSTARRSRRWRPSAGPARPGLGSSSRRRTPSDSRSEVKHETCVPSRSRAFASPRKSAARCASARSSARRGAFNARASAKNGDAMLAQTPPESALPAIGRWREGREESGASSASVTLPALRGGERSREIGARLKASAANSTGAGGSRSRCWPTAPWNITAARSGTRRWSRRSSPRRCFGVCRDGTARRLARAGGARQPSIALRRRPASPARLSRLQYY